MVFSLMESFLNQHVQELGGVGNARRAGSWSGRVLDVLSLLVLCVIDLGVIESCT
jgi:hypothetical protein